MYVNSGFDTASDGDDITDGYSVAEMLEDLQRKIEASEARLATWKEARDAAERDAVDARQVCSSSASSVKKLSGCGKKLQFFNSIPTNNFKFPTEEIMSARNFNFGAKFTPKLGF